MPIRSSNLGKDVLALARLECQAARAALELQRDASESIHEARKAIRRLRSLLAMADKRMPGLAAIDASLERLGEGLSALRDAHVTIAAAQRMAERDEAVRWQPVLDTLVRRRDRLLAQALAGDPGFSRRRGTATRVERALQKLDWTVLDKKDLRTALERSRRRARKAAKLAEAAPTAANLHRWRRRARRLRMQLEATRALVPELAKAAAKPSLRKELAALNELTDRLGWLQDLQVLRALLGKMRKVPERPLLLAQLRAAIEAADSSR